MNANQNKTVFQITEYYELAALHSALWTARFTANPIKPEIPGSPFPADVAQRIVEVLAKMEIERGHPERVNTWQIKLDPAGQVWQIIVQNASKHPDYWKTRSLDEKQAIARTFLSPMVNTEEILDEFIRQVDENTK